MIVAVLATGESLTQHIADQLEGKCAVVAVSDAYRLAPWANALVSNDSAWWRAHPGALDFAGRRYCGTQLAGTDHLPPSPRFPAGTNSGLQGMRVAHEVLGATLIVLLGFDLRGSHFFGPHPMPLKNTSPARYEQFNRQFARWQGCEVVNCTPGSALTCFRHSTLEEELRAADVFRA